MKEVLCSHFWKLYRSGFAFCSQSTMQLAVVFEMSSRPPTFLRKLIEKWTFLNFFVFYDNL